MGLSRGSWPVRGGWESFSQEGRVVHLCLGGMTCAGTHIVLGCISLRHVIRKLNQNVGTGLGKKVVLSRPRQGDERFDPLWAQKAGGGGRGSELPCSEHILSETHACQARWQLFQVGMIM